MTMFHRKGIILIFLLLLSGLSHFSQALAAANYDIKQMTPAIQQALSNRQARYMSIQDWKTQGVLGENNQGLVSMLKNHPEAASLAAAENLDRDVIYQAIVDQNGLGPVGLPKVRLAFSEVQHDKARPGDSIQLASGAWVQK